MDNNSNTIDYNEYYNEYYRYDDKQKYCQGKIFTHKL